MVKDRELLAERQDFKVQGCPASNGSSQGMEQGDENASHGGSVTLVGAKESTNPMLAALLAGRVISAST